MNSSRVILFLSHFWISFTVPMNTLTIRFHFSSLQTALKNDYTLKKNSFPGDFSIHLAAFVLSKGSSTRILALHWPGPSFCSLANLSQSPARST